MTPQKRKISLERYMEYPSHVIGFVNKKGVEVVVYDQSGPVARIAPYQKMVAISNLKEHSAKDESLATAAEMRDIREVSPEQMDNGGVWRMGSQTRKELDNTGWLKKIARLSPAEILKRAGVAGFFHNHARA
ncbi:MAG: hypothetical protein HZB29_02650 [Nitrospinae bacterium]|nr:hypothetical protein [Nitrospinota bacterium]